MSTCAASDSVGKDHALSGSHDVIAQVVTDTLGDLNRLVLKHIQQIPGVTRTLTCPVVPF